METEIYIGVGANIDPERNIPTGLSILASLMEVTASSMFYRTRPLYRPRQPDFFNGVWKVTTSLPPGKLKTEILREVESRLGRERGRDPHAPRPLDLDILLYGQLVINNEEIVLPSPDIGERPFVAVPLFELTGDIKLPAFGESLSGLVAKMDVTGLEPLRKFSDKLRNMIKHG
jgi:2-amino-4-hydroxy-6-hydroxymethyldihydropteridine diphosphokinase